MSFYFHAFIKKRVFTGRRPHYTYVLSLKLENQYYQIWMMILLIKVYKKVVEMQYRWMKK